MRLRLVCFFAVAASLCLVAYAEHRWHDHAHRWYLMHTKAPRRCLIPNYDYAPRDFEPPIRVVTAIAIEKESIDPLRVTGDPANPTPIKQRVKVFQMAKPELRIHHCSISQAAVTLLDDGTWIVNYVARQDPDTAHPDLQDQMRRFKQNRFRVMIRGLGLYETAEEPELSLVGKPELFRLTPKDVWVEQKETRFVRERGALLAARQFFDTIDRLEIDFQYE